MQLTRWHKIHLLTWELSKLFLKSLNSFMHISAMRATVRPTARCTTVPTSPICIRIQYATVLHHSRPSQCQARNCLQAPLELPVSKSQKEIVSPASDVRIWSQLHIVVMLANAICALNEVSSNFTIRIFFAFPGLRRHKSTCKLYLKSTPELTAEEKQL